MSERHEGGRPVSSANVRRSAGVAAVLAAAFILGFVAETTSLYDELWPEGVLTVIVPLFLLLIAALAAGFGEKVTFMTAVLLGLTAGCLTGIMFLLGAFSPFALELGERDLNDVGGADLAWDFALTLGLIIWGAGGAVLGAASGIAAWALHLGLGRKRSDHERDTTEAGR